MWKEEVVAYLQILSKHLPEAIKEIQGNHQSRQLDSGTSYDSRTYRMRIRSNSSGLRIGCASSVGVIAQ